MPDHRERDECRFLCKMGIHPDCWLLPGPEHHGGHGTGRTAAGTSPSENHISCLTDNAGQENARTIPENAIIVLI